MCRLLSIPRSSYYYQAVEPVSEAAFEEKIKDIFLESKSRYGTRKIKKCLEAEGIRLSRRRIGRIMNRLNLVSVYQKAASKPHAKEKNEAPIPNLLDRQFNQETFHSLEELTLKTKDYVHWWNHHRIHGSLNYQTPSPKSSRFQCLF